MNRYCFKYSLCKELGYTAHKKHDALTYWDNALLTFASSCLRQKHLAFSHQYAWYTDL